MPFFWSQHYDVTIRYTGHAESWDTVDVNGDLGARDCALKSQWKPDDDATDTGIAYMSSAELSPAVIQ